MKRFILFILILLGINTLQAASSKVIITSTTNKSYQGKFVELTDSTITFVWDMNFKLQTLSASSIATLRIDNTRYIVENGKFVSTSEQNAAVAQGNFTRTTVVAKQSDDYSRMSDPNYAIGNALRSTGRTSLAFGIPSLLTGTILLIVGTQETTNLSKAQSRGKMATAGCVLTPFGGALTVVGIPLCVKGNQILNVKFNYKGTGAGVSIEF